VKCNLNNLKLRKLRNLNENMLKDYEEIIENKEFK
jgi:hypothetical protein